MATDFPAGEAATLTLALEQPQRFTIALRRPTWAGAGFTATVNDEPVAALRAAGGYVELTREWRDGDRVALRLPKALHAEPVPDNPQRVALLWGPLVLAGDLGPEENQSEARASLPVFVTDAASVADWLKPVPGEPGVFRTDGVGRGRDVRFEPFYRLHRRTYAVYWDVFTTAQWADEEIVLAQEREAQRQLEAATVAFAQPGEMQPERDFNQQGEDTRPDRVMGRPGRRGSGWFSFDLPVDAAQPAALVVTYWTDEWRRRTFDILIDGQHLAAQTGEKGGEPRFFEVRYPLPAGLIAGKERITVRFQATQGNEIAGVFGLRTIRVKPDGETAAP